MLIAIGFWLYLLCATIIIWINGDREARSFILVVLAAAGSTAVAMALTTGKTHALTVFGIDAALLIAAIVWVSRSRSYWPIWFAGFHAITVSTEVARQWFPETIPVFYGAMASFWAIPAIACMTIAVVLDRRHRDRGIAGRQLQA